MKLIKRYFTGICILMMALGGCVQKKPRVYRVGILSGENIFSETAEGFKSKMSELGYAEGKNIVYDLQRVNNDQQAAGAAAKKFVDDKVDLIFAFPTYAAVSAQTAAVRTNIPVVFDVAVLEGNSLAKNVREPGGNITGVRYPGLEMAAKRLEILCELAPKAGRIYVAWDINYPGISYTIDSLRKVASSMKIRLIEAPVSTLKEIKDDLKSRSASPDIGIDAILIVPTVLTAFEGFGEIAKFAAEHKLAVAGTIDNHADTGAAFSYAPSLFGMGRLAAPLTDKILKGASAGTIPVASPEGNLRLNYKVIKKLGLNVSEGMLSKAKEIIR
jgi:putative tryptophan/tyrosine transport system substrate-binding protein